jgi:hypothetical protein
MTASSLRPQGAGLRQDASLRQDVSPRREVSPGRDVPPRPDASQQDDRRTRMNVVFGRLFDLATWALVVVALTI